MPDDSQVYNSVLSDAVKRFQRRHGLDDDGRLGPTTLKQLNVPLKDRVRQLQLTLERWRWLPTEFVKQTRTSNTINGGDESAIHFDQQLRAGDQQCRKRQHNK